MGYRFFTVPFCDDTGNFDDVEFQDFIRNKEVLSVTSQFFTHNGLPHWGLFVRYRSPGTKGAFPARSEKSEPYREVLQGQEDWELYEKLREWRKDKAEEKGRPVYRVFTNLQLAQIAHTRCRTLDKMGELRIGEARRRDYGAGALEIVANFQKDRESESANLKEERKDGE